MLNYVYVFFQTNTDRLSLIQKALNTEDSCDIKLCKVFPHGIVLQVRQNVLKFIQKELYQFRRNRIISNYHIYKYNKPVFNIT